MKTLSLLFIFSLLFSVGCNEGKRSMLPENNEIKITDGTPIDGTPTVSGTTPGVTITLYNTEASQIGNLVLYSGQIVFTRTTAGTGVWHTFLSLPVNRTSSRDIYGDGTETARVYVATTTTMRVWTREDATTDRDTTFFGYYLITE